ncbi:MAG: ribonuclease P protein component [Candidatus Kerfeldbacteria bacterium]|nr:ribonuclease P protein component [Candidatus Kerfeldbacteria bacterium]
MLPRRWHLASPSAFAQAYRHGRKLRADGFICWWLPISPAGPTKIGIVTSKRVALRATKRNLYRRRLWAMVRENKKFFPAQGYAMVVVATEAIADQSYANLTSQFKRILKQLTPTALNKNKHA